VCMIDVLVPPSPFDSSITILCSAVILDNIKDYHHQKDIVDNTSCKILGWKKELYTCPIQDIPHFELWCLSNSFITSSKYCLASSSERLGCTPTE
jgi:hypothetical protein